MARIPTHGVVLLALKEKFKLYRLLKKEPNKVQTAYIVYDMAPFIRCNLLESFSIKPTMNSSSLGSSLADPV